MHYHSANRALHINLDDAWAEETIPLDTLDARRWGPLLRFSAPTRVVEEFYRQVQERLAPFILYGSGDFHYLSALWLRRVEQEIVLISFDNHPDWDIRPPRWGCGGWVNRALELPHVKQVSVWGCGNFECWWPGQIFGNRRAERSGKLEVHPWADDKPSSARKRRGAILRQDWQERFLAFVKNLAGASVYVTIDLDCLRGEDAVTNWENGRFRLDDLTWALSELRHVNRIVAGDLCGAYSNPVYARRTQRLASAIDHPKVSVPDAADIANTNAEAFKTLWPLLVGLNR